MKRASLLTVTKPQSTVLANPIARESVELERPPPKRLKFVAGGTLAPDTLAPAPTVIVSGSSALPASSEPIEPVRSGQSLLTPKPVSAQTLIRVTKPLTPTATKPVVSVDSTGSQTRVYSVQYAAAAKKNKRFVEGVMYVHGGGGVISIALHDMKRFVLVSSVDCICVHLTFDRLSICV